ncbi:uncharacterized protein MELLADRAFT_109060 [Melampsora larici-populina 98AG31]|uniref:DUF6589 domain-containing protein n=1 Tax=Melampsora larici-populina (strain 98AG31 / pathotype 3-4-7) TaxID=747676 RepID=F4RV72_MELLP|nr:uncharacterized protein MELLADRAFT_109060 [Melampsora larici-populina 98AG31]EGG03719.1 hypothetical protein MELLADRAFT_109060 [Melampsora larici-populina 98AG31]
MAQSLNHGANSSGPGSTPVSFKALHRILTCIGKNHLHPKSFIEAWLSSTNLAIVKSRRRWGTGVGLESTGRLLTVIRDTVLESKAGREFWEDWVLSQAIMVARKQQPPSGSVPKGFYINASKVTPLMFDYAEVHTRDNILEQSMPFLYSLIQSIFDHNLKAQVQAADLQNSQRKPNASQNSNTSSNINLSSQSTNTQPAIDRDFNTLDSDDELSGDFEVRPVEDPEVSGLGGSTLGEDNEYVQSWDGYVFRKSKDQAQNIKNRSTSVTRTICSMVANVCNRRVNALQVENGLTMLACGVSERVNAYLQYTAIHALEHLGQELKKKLVDVMGEEHWLAPFITLDNIDFQEHVHTPTVQKESTMCNGSWGYIHRPKIPNGISSDHDTFTAEQLNTILRLAKGKPIDITDVTPTPTEIKDWNLTLKSQISHVLVKYVAEPIESKNIPYRDTPSVTPLPTEKPDIMMLKMMSASDNSTAGVGELYNEVLHQTGLSKENVVDERDPCSAPAESFQHLIMILGAAHVMWNISQAILLEHWGSHLDVKDMGAWRGIEALAGRFEKPTSKKDFTAMIRSMERLHEGSITLCIQRVMKLNVETVVKDRVKMTPERMKDVIDARYDQYFGPKAIPHAEEQCDEELGAGTSIKRLRDLYSINVPLLREFLHRLKGRSGLNDVYQSHQNNIDHCTMRNFLRMAHQHNIAACTPGSTIRGGSPKDMYALGLAKLRLLAREKKLGRFHWPKAGGLHVQERAGEDLSGSEDCDSSDDQDCDSSSDGSV